MRGTKAEVSPGVWRLRVYVGRRPDGTPIQVTKTVRAPVAKPGAGVRLADAELAKMVAKASSGRLTASSSKSVNEIVADYLAHCELEGRSPTTLREYHRLADKVVGPHLGHLRADKLSAKQLNNLYAALRDKGNRATSIRRVHALISAAFTYGYKQGVVDHNPARHASPPRLEARQVEAPSPGEVKAIIDQAEKTDPMLATLLLVAALSGARRGEVCALRWSDIDWTARTLTISRSVYETKGGGWGEKDTKTHQARRIGLDPVAVEALRRHQDRADKLARNLDLVNPEDAFVFSLSPSGSEPVRPDLITKWSAKAAHDAGVKTHLHALRHFAATQGIAAGFDPVTVGQRLGHRDPSVTLRVYAHALEQRDRDLADSLGASLTLGGE
jgi:integrase